MSEPSSTAGQRLDDADRAAVDAHLVAIGDLLAPLIARYEGGDLRDTPEGRGLLDAPARLRPSIAIAALAGPFADNTAASVVTTPRQERWPAAVVRATNRRKLDWTVTDASLAIRIVAATPYDDERALLACRAAARVSERDVGAAELLDALQRLQAALAAESNERYRVPELRARVRALVARQMPTGVVDLAPIGEDDRWGPAARAVLADAAGRGIDAIAVIDLLTGAPTTTEPSQRWLTQVDAVLGPRGPKEVVRSLVRLLVDLELPDAGPFVATGNDAIARAAVWALGATGTSKTDLDLLRRVGDRCARTSGRPYEVEALCGKAAGAAVTMLGRRRLDAPPFGPHADAALDRLWRDVDRGDVLKRIGTVLGRTPEEVRARVDEAKRTKGDAKRRTVNPQPAVRAASLAALLDGEVADRLGAAGFGERRAKTFWRHGPTHTEVVQVSIANAEVAWRFGIGFHDDAERPRWSIEQVDVAVDLALTSSDDADSYVGHELAMLTERSARRSVRGSDDQVGVLEALLIRFEAVGLPALERWRDPGALADELEQDVPFHHGRLLLGLAMPNGAERTATTAWLRSVS
ncbi:MAG: hypothetical protein KDB33_16600 [Acidimicrobiales bacterium]|nr:hypothetical protein [Acidimicrobiales bacterium]